MVERKISRRDFLKISAMGVAGIVLSACGIKAKPEAPTTRVETKPATPPLKSTEENLDLIKEARQVSDGVWELRDADGIEKSIELPEGFTPDADLKTHTADKGRDTFTKILPLPKDLSIYADFQKALNTKDGNIPPLAGYDASIELGDYNQFNEFESHPQLNMYSWKVFTGLNVIVPGIGELRGGPGKAVALIMLNRDGSIHAWTPDKPVIVERGFTVGGRIWDGQKNIDELERRLTGHWVDRLFRGYTNEFVGQCDLPENCNEVLVVTIQRRQWGENPNGSPRRIFELLRVELVAKGS